MSRLVAICAASSAVGGAHDGGLDASGQELAGRVIADLLGRIDLAETVHRHSPSGLDVLTGGSLPAHSLDRISGVGAHPRGIALTMVPARPRGYGYAPREGRRVREGSRERVAG